uniref:Zinc finger and BTB domain-containing protein 8A n=1 Tax=Geotrypetes seraphini TaxID=260995 RepID=A0A6P8RXU7_GEOSA|nr:zinc finger and BTB domain-containing protein 8A [Geotrypetes seraphini]XP_033809471.1 zinc finger and BTB domain-containing protein 8A [Geotrypetes seraphini]
MDISSYHSHLLQQLNEQRRQDLFCDCNIIVEGKIFKAHRNVLFASSGYFKMLLSQSSREAVQLTTATFEVFAPDTFKVILDFVYSGKLSLTGQNVIEVMSAASYLQMTDVISVCKAFIKSSLDISEKEKDRFFSLSDKEVSSNGADRSCLYGAGWGAESSPPHSHLASDVGACMVGGSSWNDYNYYQPTQKNNLQQGAKRDQGQDCIKKRVRHGDLSEASDIPNYKPRKSGDGSGDARASDPKKHFPQSEEQVQLDPDAEYQYGLGTERIPRGWTMNQQQLESRGAVFKCKTSTADELYATMPTILGVVGGWSEDDVPRMRFKCPFCTHMVKRKADLKRHLRCHTGERPYPCEACGKRFTRLEHLRSHFRTIHQAGKPVCRKCKRHVTELTGQVVQEGTRRYRLCNECLAEAGVDTIPIEEEEEEEDDGPPLVFSPEPDEEKDSRWHFGDEHKSDVEMVEDGSSDLIIQQVDDSEDDIEEKEIKPTVS